MLKVFVVFSFVFLNQNSYSQILDSVLNEAEKLEFKLKENEALDKYKEALTIDGNCLKALIKSSELSSAIGARQIDNKTKRLFLESAEAFAKRALLIDSSNAYVYYVLALISSKYMDIEKENKLFLHHLNFTKQFAEKSIAIDSSFAKSFFIIGNWHFALVNYSGFKKTAAKFLHGNLPKYTLEDAIRNFEKCLKYDSYYMINYLQLAKAYNQDNNPRKAIEILQKLIKLPLRTADDATIKETGKKLLSTLQ